MQLNAGNLITLNLTAQQVQLIVTALSGMPYLQVAALIPEIVNQTNGHQASEGKVPQPRTAGEYQPTSGPKPVGPPRESHIPQPAGTRKEG